MAGTPREKSKRSSTVGRSMRCPPPLFFSIAFSLQKKPVLTSAAGRCRGAVAPPAPARGRTRMFSCGSALLKRRSWACCVRFFWCEGEESSLEELSHASGEKKSSERAKIISKSKKSKQPSPLRPHYFFFFFYLLAQRETSSLALSLSLSVHRDALLALDDNEEHQHQQLRKLEQAGCCTSAAAAAAA